MFRSESLQWNLSEVFFSKLSQPINFATKLNWPKNNRKPFFLVAVAKKASNKGNVTWNSAVLCKLRTSKFDELYTRQAFNLKVSINFSTAEFISFQFFFCFQRLMQKVTRLNYLKWTWWRRWVDSIWSFFPF